MFFIVYVIVELMEMSEVQNELHKSKVLKENWIACGIVFVEFIKCLYFIGYSHIITLL